VSNSDNLEKGETRGSQLCR